MAASSTSAAGNQDSAGVKFPPLVFFILCLAAGISVEQWLWSAGPLLPQPVGLYTGLALAAAGLVFMACGVGRFLVSGVNPVPFCPAAKLMTGGLYRISRNPMYVGLIAALLGIGFTLDSLPVLASALVMYLYLRWYVIRREEKYLARTFGSEYQAYCRKVRRWL